MKKRNKVILILSCLLLIASVCFSLFIGSKNSKAKEKEKEETINYNDYFYDKVKIIGDKKLYKEVDGKIVEWGNIKNIPLELISDNYLNNGYFKIKDTNYYIDYKNIQEYKNENENETDPFYLNYVPYNESIKTKDKTTLYSDKDTKLEVATINDSFILPITIKEEGAFGVVINDKLYYLKKDSGEVIENHNTDLKHTDSFSALVYHSVYDSTNEEEKKQCLNANSTICLSNIQFKSHLQYLKDNGYYSATMNDVEMFMDKKVQLPYKTVVITIDDGYFVDASIKVLEELDMHATLFLVGVVGSPKNYASPNLEIHSHSYNMHGAGMCPGGQGSAFKCKDKKILLEDLKKSREQLNGSTVFCYPFFEYNDYAIEIVKEAGFTMGFVGGRRRITLESNKLILPRYGVVSTTTVEDIANIVKVN